MPIFADLQGFVVGGKFHVKEVAVLRKGEELTHHVFRAPIPWSQLTRDEKQQVNWLTVNYHHLHWKDGDIDYRHARRLIQRAVLEGLYDDDDDEKMIVYVKGLEKTTWLRNYLGNDHSCNLLNIEIDYEEIERLKELPTTRALHCRRHKKNCAMENAVKLYDWWSARKREISPLVRKSVNKSDDDRDDGGKRKRNPSTLAFHDTDDLLNLNDLSINV